MNERKNRLRAGIFVVLTTSLFLVMLFYLGVSEIFMRKAEATTCFSESVQGLSVGSEVKFQGVKVGTVKEISILVKEKLIKIDMDIELEHFEGVGDSDDSDIRNYKFREFMKNEIKNGIRCRLEFVGITGMKYVSLDYYAKPGEILPETPFESAAEESVYVPAVSSTFKDVMVAMTRALDRLSRVKFETVFLQVEDVLKELNSTLSAPEIRAILKNAEKLTANLEHTTATVNNVFNEKRVKETASQLEQTMNSVNELVKKLSITAEQMKLPETSAEIRQASGAVQDTRQELVSTILKLNEAIEALRKLCETINDNPGFLFGSGKIAE